MANGFADVIDGIIEDAGVPYRIQKPTLTRIVDAIANTEAFKKFPIEGLGIVGPTGCGKSCAAIYLAKITLARAIKNAGPYTYRRNEAGDLVQIRPKQTPTLIYIDVPSRLRQISQTISEQRFNDPAASLESEIQIIRSGKTVILVLDDLARESVKKDGKARAELDALVSEAYNAPKLRLLWTSNLEVEKLEPIYGAPFVSRLLAIAPDMVLPQHLKDKRITA